jgi:hypothetical protein
MKLVPDTEFQRLNNELRRKVKLEVDHLGGGNEGVSAFSHHSLGAGAEAQRSRWNFLHP